MNKFLNERAYYAEKARRQETGSKKKKFLCFFQAKVVGKYPQVVPYLFTACKCYKKREFIPESELIYITYYTFTITYIFIF